MAIILTKRTACHIILRLSIIVWYSIQMSDEGISRNESEFPYTRLTPDEYRGLLAVINLNYVETLRAQLSLFDLGNACLILVGSDGRLERHYQSRTEIVIIQRFKDQDTIQRLIDYWGATTFIRDFGVKMKNKVIYPDAKVLDDQDVPISYAFGNPDTVYPDRIVNTTLIVGDSELYYMDRTRALVEMTGNDQTSKRVRDHMKKQLREYRRALKTGTFANRRIFECAGEQGMQIYDEDPSNYAAGFKTSHLRTVQRKSNLLTVAAIRNGMLDLSEAAFRLPPTTHHLIRFLAKRGLLPNPYNDPAIRESLITAYSWFLQQYHHAQNRYKATGERVLLPFNGDEFFNHSRIIEQFANSR